jgi:arabinan endo-1,5-alpha-L-arabinosidase
MGLNAKRTRMGKRIYTTYSGLVVLALLVSTAPPVVAQYVNIRVHDPVMIRQDSRYYLFSTGPGIAVWSSEDMENWQREDPVFGETPTWAGSVVPGFRNFEWAPDISYHDGTYYLYYSVSAFGKNTSAIGVATNSTLHPDDPAFKWVDHGPVVESVPGRDMFNAIDPNLVEDEDGTPWLVFGSFWSGLKQFRLNQDRTRPAEPQEWYTVAARHRYWKLDELDAGDSFSSRIEGPFIFRKNGVYYLFVSWDRCCSGAESTYKVVVGRSENVFGPFMDKEGEDMRLGGGSLVVRGNDKWAGVGHNSAYTFDGKDYLVFHGYDLSDKGMPKLWIKEIVWDEDGWPKVTLD